MKKLQKLLLAALLVTSAATGLVGCTHGKTTTQTTDTGSPTDASVQGQRAAFTAALVAESKMISLFSQQQGLQNGQVVNYWAPTQNKETDAIGFLSNYWDTTLAKKEYDSYLGSKALLDQANAAFKAQNDKDNQGKKPADQNTFTPFTQIGDPAKIGHNDLFSAGATFETSKITVLPTKYIIEYKGLTYTVEIQSGSFFVTAKTGHLQ